jgi:hypothetical protein
VTKKVVAAGLIAVVVIGAVVIYQTFSEDERPIRVRNGSMEILAAAPDGKNAWRWELEDQGDNVDPTPSYSHEPDDILIDTERTLWVKVVRRTGACASGDRTSGNTVRVEYTPGNFAATFKRGKSGSLNYRTKVRPTSDLTLDTSPSPPVLRHGTAGTGFVARVRVNNWTCEFPDANALDVIYICSSDNRAECQ